MPADESASNPVAAGKSAEPTRRPSSLADGQLSSFAWRVVIGLLLLAVAYILWSGIRVLLLAFAGILLATALGRVSRWISERTGWSHRISLSAAVTALVLLMGGLTWLLASTIIGQITELTQQLPQLLQRAREQLQQYSWAHYILEQAPKGAESLARTDAFSKATGLASGMAYLLEAAIVILVVGVFGAADPDVYKRGLLYLLPPRHRGRMSQILSEVSHDLCAWLLGQGALMVVIGLTSALGLWLLGIPLALTLGLITGILELIPYIGAWIAFLPAALVSLQLGVPHLLMTGGLFMGLHVLEGYVVGPLIQRRAVHLPPALTLVAQMLMGELLGVLGVFVAAPLTVAVLVLVRNLYIEDALGDPSVNESNVGEVQRTGN